MSAVAVRRAQPADVPAIATVHVRAWQAAYRGILPDALLDELSVSEREGAWRALFAGAEGRWSVLIAEADRDEPRGFCATATPSRDEDADPTCAEVAALYVDPERWRQGTGGALLDAALEELSWRDFREAILWVLPANRDAIAFYRRFGFAVDEGVEKVEERSGHKVVRLRRDLPGRQM